MSRNIAYSRHYVGYTHQSYWTSIYSSSFGYFDIVRWRQEMYQTDNKFSLQKSPKGFFSVGNLWVPSLNDGVCGKIVGEIANFVNSIVA